jgi:diguanylate cyclase (GGDEF)-like protein
MAPRQLLVNRLGIYLSQPRTERLEKSMSKRLLLAQESPSGSTGKSRFWRLGIPFPEHLEGPFQEEMDLIRSRRSWRTGLVALAIYGLFAITDRTMLPDAYLKAWAIRFLLVMPLMAICIITVYRVPRLVVREVTLAATVVLVAGSILWIAGLSQDHYAIRYHSGVSLVVLFGNIVLGLRFRSAVAGSVLIAAMFAIALMQISLIPAEVRFSNWMVFAVAVVISLIANFRMEQDQRHAYLARLREKEQNEELSHAVELLGRLSAEDALTQTANRREFDRRLMLEWGRARREGQSLALILVDVDCFKKFNDRYGHPAGDDCLRQVAAILRSVPQRSSDLVARLGGEEFGVLLPGTSIADAAQLADHMRQAIFGLQLPHAASDVASVVSASFGVAAILPTSQDEPAELLGSADAALYSAKKNGRNRVVVDHD